MLCEADIYSPFTLPSYQVRVCSWRRPSSPTATPPPPPLLVWPSLSSIASSSTETGIVHPESLRMHAQCELRVRVITPLQHTHFSACRFCFVGGHASCAYAYVLYMYIIYNTIAIHVQVMYNHA